MPLFLGKMRWNNTTIVIQYFKRNFVELATSNKKEWVNTFFLVSGYGLFLLCFQCFLYRAGFVTIFPNSETLLKFDASVYLDIAKHGYSYPDPVSNNTGCYVLFPWVWRLLRVGVLGVCLFNLLFFSIAFTLFTYIYPVSSTDKLLWLTIPSLYFIVAPYTEALFCLLTVISFYGIVKDKVWIIWIGLFLVSLTRATAVFLIPSLLIMELLTNDRKDVFKTFITYLVKFAFPTIAGFFTFAWIQYYDTGIWFVYYKQQIRCLGHKWAMPILPFSNLIGDKITWLSALAMLACVAALIIIVIKFFRWLFNNEKNSDKIFILTLSYLPVILFTMIFCNPAWGGTTNLLGLHRYTFCTPFIFVFLYHFTSGKHNYRIKDFLYMFVLCNLVWLSMGSYRDKQHLVFYNFNTLLVFGFMLYANKKTNWIAIALTAVNFFLQAYLFQQYLQGAFTD